jgi:aminotransferase
VITVGSQEAMFAVLLTLVGPGDEVLFPNPGYPAYETMIRLLGATAVPYPLRFGNRFRVDPDELKPLLTKRSRLLILCNPSNPTGALEPEENLKRLAALLAAHGVAWVSDEIYSAFAYQGPYVSLASVADPATGLLVSSLSKDLAMTGWRVGWVAGPPAVIGRIEAAHQYLVTCAPTISQTAARAAFSPEGECLRDEARATFRARRARMADELGKIPGISFHLPDGAFYFFVDTSRFGPSLPLCTRILERRKVVTIAGTAFGALGEGFLRLSYAATDESITNGIRAIAEELAS